MSGPERLDSRGAWEATAALPDQLGDALADAERAWADIASPPAVDAIVVLGTGTDALAGDAVAALTATRSPVPVLVPSTRGLPAFVGPRSLVVAVSSSGQDADTTANAGAALGRGSRAVVVAADGPLSSLAVEAGVPWCPLAAGEAPRTLFGAAVVSVLAALARYGVVPDCGPSVTSAAAALRRRHDAFAAP